ncbi:hypothetical protein [Undibacterium sp. Di24W]|uniref:hypothetical protein n=1 Tax=Undibacterium sp. Di24W TaxID=3413033 RepID=UPI003BF119DB
MQDEILARISACEHENTRLKKRLRLQNLLFSTLFLVGVGGSAVAALSANSSDTKTPRTIDSLRVKELIVVDGRDVVRARVGGDIPPAVIDGKTLSRGGTNNGVAGIMLYDKTGVERGGYVTFDQGDNVALTLDNQKKQQVFFGVGSTGTASLQLWEDDEMLDLRADTNGARFTRTKAGLVTHQYPETSIKKASCEYYKNGIKEEHAEGLPYATVKKICERRFSAASCEPCLPTKS